MSISEKLQNMNLPNIQSLMKSTKSAKEKLDNVDMNIVNVNFFYADNRFKTSIKGEILHITDMPICIIEYPEKLAYLVLDESLIYDVKNQCFEIYVNEKYTHALEIAEQNTDLPGITKIIIPKIPKTFKYKLIEMNPPKTSLNTAKILLTSSIFYSLARSKILERTREQDNDGLIIVGLLGLMVGAVLGFIICLALIGGGA